MPRAVRRCHWARLTNPLYLRYHDEEWGVPSHDDRHLFEMLILEGAQAGLSWETILNKRAAYRRAFQRFDPKKIARWTKADVAKRLRDPGIVRNRLKIESAVTNARAFLALREEAGSFDAWLWRWVDGKPIQNATGKVPARTPLSDEISKELQKRGFKFVGSTILYAYLQAVGLVNDHAAGCFRRAAVKRMAQAFSRSAAAGRRARAPAPSRRLRAR